jgi:hypothetical protein
MGVMQKHACEPANGIIDRFGGVSAVARLLDKDESTIRRWRMPKPSGTGGTIPDDDKMRLLEAAKSEGVRLAWRDFKPIEKGIGA